MVSLAQLRASISPEARNKLDWIWNYYLTEGEWPTDRRIYRDTLRPEFERILGTLNGSFLQEVEEQDTKRYHVMPLGILGTSRGPQYEALLRKYVGYLREIFYHHDKQNSVHHSEVQSALAFTNEETAMLGRLLKVNILHTPPGHHPDFSIWSAPLPRGLGDILPHQGSTDEAFEILIRRHWFPQSKISSYERAQQSWSLPPEIDAVFQAGVVKASKRRPGKRERILPTAAAEVLIESGRRCALCFGLNGDLAIKHGQIAHLDRKPGNSRKTNLVWLCLPHHAEYDTVSNRNRGIMPEELKRYLEQLRNAIRRKEHHSGKAGTSESRSDSALLPFTAEIRTSPVGAVLQAWQMVEKYALGVLQTKMVMHNPQSVSGGIRSRLLRDFAGMDLAHAELHDQLNNIRNAVAQGAVIDENQARDFCAKAVELAAYLGKK